MTLLQLLSLAGLGAFHGLNPAMGWLFAVARGMQERSRRVLLTSLLPIAAGHLASVAIVAAVVSATASVVAANIVGVAGGALLVAYGLWRLLSERHFRWAGMRLSAAQLAGWSFLVSSAHGAGLMLLPVLATSPITTGGGGPAAGAQQAGQAGQAELAGHAGHVMAAPAAGALEGLGAAGVHTIAMLTAMALCALITYEFVGVSILRKAWFNMDRLWAAVMVGAGAVTIALAV